MFKLISIKLLINSTPAAGAGVGKKTVSLNCLSAHSFQSVGFASPGRWQAPFGDASSPGRWQAPFGHASSPGRWQAPFGHASSPGRWQAPFGDASSPGRWQAPFGHASSPGRWQAPFGHASSPGRWQAPSGHASSPGRWQAPSGHASSIVSAHILGSGNCLFCERLASRARVTHQRVRTTLFNYYGARNIGCKVSRA